MVKRRREEREILRSTRIKRAASGISNFDIITLDDDDLDPKPTTSFSKSSNRGGNEGRKYVQDYIPIRSAELAVNPAKLEELRSFIKEFSLKKGLMQRCLLVTGPSGCGKTTSVEIIAKELGYEVSDFVSEQTYETLDDYGQSGIICEDSEESSFISFLRKADYGNLELKSSALDSPMNKVLIIEQLPNAFLKDPILFRKTIAPLLWLNRSLIVFIFSDSDSTYELSHRRFFTREFICQNNIAEISFNASATKFLQKALQRIALACDVIAPTQELKRIAEEAEGDIRCALRTLQFSISNDGTWVQGVHPTTNNQINIFHTLGRILYAKRVDDTPKNKEIENRLLQIDLRRPPLERNLEEILLNSGLPDDQISIFLLQHAPHFAKSIKSLSSIMSMLAICDSQNPTFYENRDRMLKQSKSFIAASTIMFENYQPAGSQSKKTLYKFTKSTWPDLHRNIVTLKSETETCARLHNLDASQDLFTLRVPLSKYTNPDLDSLSLQTVGYLRRRMNFPWTIDRDLWVQAEIRNGFVPLSCRTSSSQATTTTPSTQPTFDFDIEEDSD